MFQGFSRVVEDNAPPHRSAYTAKKLKEWKIETLGWPPESPDLNHIELVWGNMKAFAKKQRVRAIPGLKIAVASCWKSLTPEQCQRYIRGVQWRMERILKAEGGNVVENK
ncbi:hypothetical protein ANCDUO_26924 [Ancylostoma duodenale]|uniref:Tc1-like transposase DDE domain-containing protein n=1 Tax=Ancylostoma duodenale TaxID=51022 RepID=A0A0C2F828_9BILA|nr:hypothetical protein ANCDUO_26924 [Ancylostoma duodenale]